MLEVRRLCSRKLLLRVVPRRVNPALRRQQHGLEPSRRRHFFGALRLLELSANLQYPVQRKQTLQTRQSTRVDCRADWNIVLDYCHGIDLKRNFKTGSLFLLFLPNTQSCEVWQKQ